MSDKIRVLVVDDSSLVRKVIEEMLETDPGIEVIGTANNGKTAIARNAELNPDVITLDIEMPVMDGLTALKEIMSSNPKPVIMLSVLTQHGAEATFKALEYGAVDFIPKPSSLVSLSVDEIRELLIGKVKSVAHTRVQSRPHEDATQWSELKKVSDKHKAAAISQDSYDKIVGIGTSTGGPSALISIFQNLPRTFSTPILVVQHMPEGFTRAFADRLNTMSHLLVKEAEDGDIIRPGTAFIAPGNCHIAIETNGSEKSVKVFGGEKVSGHRPSIDVMFMSLAEKIGPKTLGVIMTGMGRDGADGLLKIKEAGGYTLAQDEKTSVVYGMNRVAVQQEAVAEIVPLSELSIKIDESIKSKIK
jgi:two-component system chemotaxis response regulator CheB